MGKQGKARKRKRLDTALAPEGVDGSENEGEREAIIVDSLLSENDIKITLRTLKILSSNAELYKSSSSRPIRVAINELINNGKQLGFHLSNTLIGKAGDAIHDHNWKDALNYLSQLRDSNIIPKLGSLQRWVRDCDAASGKDGSGYNNEVLEVLDSILRTVDPGQISQKHEIKTLPLIHHPPFIGKPNSLFDSVPRGNVSTTPSLYNESNFRVVLFEKGAERKPPNEFDMNLWTNIPGVIKMENLDPVQRIDIPDVAGAFLLNNVLSKEECKQIITAAETLEFAPDKPLGESNSVLAHNFFWLVDKELNDTIFKRCQNHFPPIMGGDGPPAGINARWRVFRYVKGSVYRPHVDGAWPGCGLDDEGKYLYDAFNGEKWSKLTFLLYLNEDFEGGCTTFFTPSAKDGIMDANGVKPRVGSVLCFPHGDTLGSLLHEGSAVLGEGRKYVIRSDVLYMIEKHKKPLL